jgi:SAM-dependent methyltransferase
MSFEKLSPYLPLTYIDILVRLLRPCKTVLDVGCGKGRLMKNLKMRSNIYSVGLDIYLPDLKVAKKRKTHDDFIVADARWLPVRPKSFDCVLCSHVIEHLTQKMGVKLIKTIEKISRVRVIIATPIGYQPHVPLDLENEDNPFQVHRSGWLPEFFTSRGYHVRFQGLKLVYGLQGSALRFKVPRALMPLVILFFFFPFVFLVYFMRNLAINQVVWKDFRNNHLEQLGSYDDSLLAIC